MNRQRRALLQGLGAAALAAPWRTSSAAAPRVIVIGGGFGGAACARTLRALAPTLAITLIEPRRHFYTGPGTNAALVEVSAEGDIVRGPAALRDQGIDWLEQHALALDPVTRRVRLADGRELQADRIVVSPGIALLPQRIEGLDAAAMEAMPHAWLGDAQVPALRRRIAALPDGATVAISAPALPYRCPPGPYERASLIAWRLAQGRRRCKILVLDAKDDFTKRALFQFGWDTLYPGMIEWLPRAQGGELLRVDAARGRLHLASGQSLRVDLASIIPPQRAAALAQDAGLADESGWCPVDPLGFESLRHPGIHVIGDAAAAHPMPKSAFSANSQAKQAALAIVAALAGRAPPEPRLVNTCYSLLAPDYAISVGGLYGVAKGRLNTLNDGMSPLAATPQWRAREAAYAHDWYAHITRDTFG